jgi:DNA adenine methylase
VDCRWNPERICSEIWRLHDILTPKLNPNRIHVKNTNLDFEQVIRENSQKALLYIDPPYFGEGNGLYQCGMSVADHKRLQELLKETDHVWIASYDDHPHIRELYDWANIREIEHFYSTSKKSKKELIITKGK